MATLEIKSKKEFNTATRNGVTVVDFNAPWCGPCHSQEPILEEVATNFDGKATVAAINIEEHQDIARELGIQSIPTLIFYKDNQEVLRFIGLQSEKEISDALVKLLD